LDRIGGEIMKKLKMFRLVAADGMILTNGEVQGKVVDVLADRVSEWSEIEDAEYYDIEEVK